MKKAFENHSFVFSLLCIVPVLLLLSGCAGFYTETEPNSEVRTISPPKPLRPPKKVYAGSKAETPTVRKKPAGAKDIRFRATPPVKAFLPSEFPSRMSDDHRGGSEGEPIQLNLNAVPLPAFINEVYGNILGVSFEIDSRLQHKADLVTLRTEEPLKPKALEKVVRRVLANYGVTVEKQGVLLRFVPGGVGIPGEPPLLVSGQALPEVPISHRPIFQLAPLKVVRNVHVGTWLRKIYQGMQLTIHEDPERNAVMLMGPPDVVREALNAVRFLDRPYMRGRHSVRIDPVFLDAKTLADMLNEVLNTEGYSASLKPPMGSIIIMPVTAVNAVIVFTADADILEHIKKWAVSLDKPGHQDEKSPRLHYYQVQNTRAADLASVLDQVTPGTIKTTGEKTEHRPLSRRLVVDENRNALIFQGDSVEWENLAPVIRKMDTPSRLVLIEVTVAEITLNDQEELGVEWIFNDISMDDVTGVMGTMGGLGLGGSGLNFTLDNAGQTRAALNALASHSRVTILSTPRLMVKSGNKATIDVGTEVPIITSQSTSAELQQDGDSGIIQEIQYRKTGVLLTVSPVVYSNNRVDLDITQEVSETQPDSAGAIPSPSIFTRKINTSLGLDDGGSVLLGGLISTTSGKGYKGVPVLSKIPLLGRLFRVETENRSRTELIMLIIPYVIDNGKDAVDITNEFRKQFSPM